MKPQEALIGVVLAAGLGSRFAKSKGGCKLTQPCGKGPQTVIEHSTAALSSACDAVYVVTGHWRQEVSAALGLNASRTLHALHCPDFALGLGRSLKTAVAQTQPSIGWLITLGDMPYIQPETYRQVAQALTQGALLARPFYHGRPGHPVGFSHRLREALLSIADEGGAHNIIHHRATALIRLDVDDAGCVHDLDTPEDFNATSC